MMAQTAISRRDAGYPQRAPTSLISESLPPCAA
jgi:hypothetical protein